MPVLYDGARHVSTQHAIVDALQFVECDSPQGVRAFWRQYFDFADFTRWRGVTDVTPFDDGFLVPYRKYFDGHFRLPEHEVAIYVERPTKAMLDLEAEAEARFDKAQPSWMIALYDYWKRRLEPRKSYRLQNHVTLMSDEDDALTPAAQAMGMHVIFADEGSLPATLPKGFAVQGIVHEAKRIYVANEVGIDIKPSRTSLLIAPDVDLWGAYNGSNELVALYLDHETDTMKEASFGKRFHMTPDASEIAIAPMVNPLVMRPVDSNERLRPWHYGQGIPLHVFFGKTGQVLWFEPIVYDYFDADIEQTTGAFASWEDVMRATPTKALRL
ncbi:MAG: hypothetical protein D6683_01510 [Actinomyces sp.]|nr:MAG: hypothetical protein D6683_01510 [Actinomyces sp.]